MLDNRPILVGSILLLVVPTHLQLVEDTLRRAVSQLLVAFLVQCHPILEASLYILLPTFVVNIPIVNSINE